MKTFVVRSTKREVEVVARDRESAISIFSRHFPEAPVEIARL